MLNFIVGVKNSGKTKKAHEILGKSISKGTEAMIIVPKQFTFETDKGLLSLLGPKTACEIEVLSFSRLCHVAVSTYGGIKEPIAGQGMREIFMSSAIESLKDKLRVFSKHKNEIALVKKMIKEIDELKSSAITYEDLKESAEIIRDPVLKNKLKETALIYQTYDALISQSHFDDANLLSRVYEILVGTDFLKGKTIVIDGFKSFTAPEYSLIELMLKNAQDVYITLCSDNIESAEEMGAFSYVNATARKLRLLAGNNGVALGQIIKTKRNETKFSEEMFFLEKNIYNKNYCTYEKEIHNLMIIEANSIEDECDAVARKIKALIRQEKYRMRDIAVVFRQSEKYEQCVKNSLKKYALSIFEDKRQPIKNQPLICYVKNLLLIMSEGFNSDYIFRMLKSGLSGFSEAELAQIENYVFTWDINGKKWLNDFKGNPDGFGSSFDDEEKRERLALINETRIKIIEPLLSLRQKLICAQGKNIAEVIYYFLRENQVDVSLKNYAIALQEKGLSELAIEQEQVWDLLMEAFSEMAQALEDRPVSLKRFCELFDLVISGKSLGKLPDGYDEVYVCDGDRILTKSAKVVFLIGMNSGVFPIEPKENGLFSSFEKKKLSEIGTEIGEDIKNQILSEKFICYSAMASAMDMLFMSYSTSNGTEKLTESECVREIKKIFPGCTTERTGEQDIYQLIESEQSAFEIMAKKRLSCDDEYETLKEYFKSNEKFKGRMEAIERAVSDKDFAFENKEISKELFGKNMYFSASQLEVYSKCPFMYFCRYGVKAKVRPKAKLDAAMGGNVVHYVLEKVLKNHKGKDFLNLSSKEIDDEIRKYLKEYMALYMGDSENMSTRFNYLYNRLYKVLHHIFERLVAEFSDSDFEPCDFELEIGKEKEVKPFKVELEYGSVELIGKIDRVDKMDIGDKRYIRIVDYKTGTKEFKLSDVFYGINMQMLLYLISIWRGGTEFYENITPSGILYFPAKLSACNVERTDEEESKTDKALTMGKMSGMLVLDGESIAGMDKSKKNIFIPVKFDKKTGNVKGDFITLKQLQKLGEMMDGIIKNMGDSLHEGLVNARPIFGPNHGETCEWCDYKDVCLKDKPKVRYAEKMSHDECIRKLMGGENDGEKLD